VEEQLAETSAGDSTKSAVAGTQSAVAGTESAEAGTENAVVEALETTNTKSAEAGTQSPVAGTQSAAAGTQSAVVEPVETTDTSLADTDLRVKPEDATKSLEDDTEPETYVGISSQLNVNFISVEDLIALAEDTIKEQGETIEDISIPVDDTVDFERYVEEQLAETSAVVGTENAVVEALETTNAKNDYE
jgi:hypothetical protein